MSRNTMLSLVALLVIGLAGLGGAYWAYKKIMTRKHQEMMYKTPIGTAQAGFDPDQHEQVILTEKLLDELVAQHQLVSVWALPDENAAKARIREKFIVSVEEGTVKASYQDKDEVLAKALFEAIMSDYQNRMRAAGNIPGGQ